MNYSATVYRSVSHHRVRSINYSVEIFANSLKKFQARCACQYRDECMLARMHDSNMYMRAARELAEAIQIILTVILLLTVTITDRARD